ncbi:hypothetical protein GGI17_001717, partial [Coemansia sp. S146]
MSSSPAATVAAAAANPTMITPVILSSVSAATAVPIPAYAANQTPSTGGYRPSTPSCTGHAHTFNS